MRTQLDVRELGGAKVTAFDLADAEKAVKLDHLGGDGFQEQATDQKMAAETLWDNLKAFLEEVIPVAEAAGVDLAILSALN